MPKNLAQRVEKQKMTRRDFLWLATVTTTGAAVATATGCAVNPVTGESQLMLLSESGEVAIDKQYSPHQFSSDFGAFQDQRVNSYVNNVGVNMGRLSHRPKMPYSFRAVNATYVNAYTFPGGSCACTRGILLELEDEAELAGLLGHELGHVNMRHTAERMTRGMLAQGLLAGATVAADAYAPGSGQAVQSLGGVGAGALLAKYSRDDEREADALGMEYMTRGGYNPHGMVGLMEVLVGLNKHEPNIIQQMFSSHPMSDERYNTAVQQASTKYAFAKKMPSNRERYMDNVAPIRRQASTIKELQNGDKMMRGKKYRTAENHYKRALSMTPNDYAGLIMMSKCQVAMKKQSSADRYAQLAKRAYPQEAQGYQMSGIIKFMGNQYGAAFNEFHTYERMMPGNANIIFLKGLSQEGMGHRDNAAYEYNRYLKSSGQGQPAKYSYQRLVDWGYIAPRKQQ